MNVGVSNVNPHPTQEQLCFATQKSMKLVPICVSLRRNVTKTTDESSAVAIRKVRCDSTARVLLLYRTLWGSRGFELPGMRGGFVLDTDGCDLQSKGNLRQPEIFLASSVHTLTKLRAQLCQT